MRWMMRKMTAGVALAGLVALLVTTATAGAMNASQSSGEAAGDAGQSEGEGEGRTFELDFAGGTVDAYVEALRDVVPEANVVVVGDAGSVPLPAMRLRGVSVRAAMEFLNDLEQAVDWQTVRLAVSATGEQVGRSGRGRMRIEEIAGQRIYTVTARRTEERDERASSPPRRANVISIGDLIENGRPPEELLTAVEAAVEILDEQVPEPVVRFHEATGMIIARGTAEQMNMISRVISELRKGVERTAASGEWAMQANRLVEERQSLLERLDGRQAAVDQLTRQRTEWRTRSETLQKEVERLMRQLEEREAMVLRLRQELLETQNRNSELLRELGRFRQGRQRSRENSDPTGGTASPD